MKNFISSVLEEITGKNNMFFYDYQDKGIHIRVEALENGIYTNDAKIEKGSIFRVIIYGVNKEYKNETNFQDEKYSFKLVYNFDGTLNFILDDSFDISSLFIKEEISISRKVLNDLLNGYIEDFIAVFELNEKKIKNLHSVLLNVTNKKLERNNLMHETYGRVVTLKFLLKNEVEYRNDFYKTVSNTIESLCD